MLVSAAISVVPQTGTACPNSDTDRASGVKTALESGYGVQYWGSSFQADVLASSPHGMLIIEATKVGASDTLDGREVIFSPKEMDKIRQQGARPVLVYLNLTELEPWRDYWPHDGHVPAWLGPETATGDKLAAFWRPEWRAILRERVIRLLNTGADGLFLDDALNYFVAGSLKGDGAGQPSDVQAAAEIMLAVVQEITDQARSLRCDAIIVVNNGVFLGRDAGAEHSDAFDSYRTAIDGIMIEDGLGGADTPNLHAALREDYLAFGVPVLSLDFAPDAKSEAVINAARTKGYFPYVVPDGSFSSLRPPSLIEP